MKISEEQKKIIFTINKTNVIVDAVAGSGKTTTVLCISKYYPNKNILLITYNRRLCDETIQRAKQKNLNNINIYTYHAFCQKYYNIICHNDMHLLNFLNLKDESQNKPKKEINFDIVIFDEVQDMIPIFYRLARKILKENNIKAKICLLGDIYQCIYEYNCSDSRFLTMADKIFNDLNDFPWTKLNLSISYRLTNTMADFINICVLKEDRIKTVKTSDRKPSYHKTDYFDFKPVDQNKKISVFYNRYLETMLKKEKYDDILIISPSVSKKKCPIIPLSNFLARQGISICISDNDNSNYKYTIGKLLISTFHQTKGLERKYVFVMNFDNSYFKYYGRNFVKNKCPNILYVALSRASEKLYLFQESKQELLEFINKDQIKNYTEYKDDEPYKEVIKKDIIEKKKRKSIDKSVRDLCRQIPLNVMTKILSYFDKECINEPNEKYNFKSEIQYNGKYENVSNINGIAIVSCFEYMKKNNMNILKIYKLVKERQNTNDNICKRDLIYKKLTNLDKINYNLRKFPKNRNELLQISNVANANISKLVYKVRQIPIKKYNWISSKNILKAVDRLNNRIKNDFITEELMACEFIDKNDNTFNIFGAIDIIEGNNIWEIKCVSELTDEHFIQLICYAYIYNKIQPVQLTDYNYYLYNVLSDELWKITFTMENLEKIMKILFNHETVVLTDDEFLENINKLKE